MMRFTVGSDGEEQAAEFLADLQYRVVDLMPLAVRVGELIEVDNMAARMLGVDKDGAPFADLAPATVADPRRGPGPALAPMEMSSRVISGLEVELLTLGIGAIDVVGSWPSMPFLHHHVTGTKHMPARDPVGIRPEGWAAIEAELDRFAGSLLG
jgi:hypothetical protein